MSAKVVLKMRQTIDGFVCTPSGDDSFLFAHIDEEAFKWETEHLWRAGIHVMGKNLYHNMAAYWPSSNALAAAPMNEIPKAVFSKTLKEVPWGPTRILRGSPVEEIALLKQQFNKDIFVHGGASLAQSLAVLDLIDEYRILIHPVTLGNGKPWIATPIKLHLNSTHKFTSGVVALIYSRA
jgi:dihydrofolate reductase